MERYLQRVRSPVNPSPYAVPLARVSDKRGVNVFEHALLDHDDLPAYGFLCRSAQHSPRGTELVGRANPGHGQAGGYCHGSHKVVPASVTDPRQGVVLGHKSDIWTLVANACHKCGGKIGHAGFHRESVVA